MLENLIKDAHGTIGYKPLAVLLIPLRLPAFRNFGWRGSAWWNKVAHLEIIDAQMRISKSVLFEVELSTFCKLRSKQMVIERCNAGGLKDRDSWSLSSPIAPHLRDVTHLAQPQSPPLLISATDANLMIRKLYHPVVRRNICSGRLLERPRLGGCEFCLRIVTREGNLLILLNEGLNHDVAAAPRD